MSIKPWSPIRVSGQSDIRCLQSIRSARGNDKAIRWIVRGDLDVCLRLFKLAIYCYDLISAIELSYACFSIKKDIKANINYSSITVNELEDRLFRNMQHGWFLTRVVFSEAFKDGSQIRKDALVTDIYNRAANNGYLLARFGIIMKKWSPYIASYGLATMLLPYVGQGCDLLDFYFGFSMKCGTAERSMGFYEGMYWMFRSGQIPVIYPDEGESFEDACCRESYCSPLHDGLAHLPGAGILAPSVEVWEQFKADKFSSFGAIPQTCRLFPFDPKAIQELCKQQNIKLSTVFKNPGNSSFYIRCGDDIAGRISVNTSTFQLQETFEDATIQPVIDFVENVITVSSSAISAVQWLERLMEPGFID